MNREKEEHNIVYLNTKCLYQHPHNPRRELGSLMELAASIRANGVMQNLTVVPVSESGIDENETPAYNGSERCFYVLIGNRRLAAAKLAGTEQVPCVIRTGLSLKDQVAIMLTENMQRNDLTVYEQAKGIKQMMMDFGETVEGIVKSTGLSRTTVERRKKLADLPEKEFKKAEGKGATLMDLEKVAKVKSEKVRKSLLTDFGTNNFEWKMEMALKQEKAADRIDGMVKVLESEGIEKKEHADYEHDINVLSTGGMEADYLMQKIIDMFYTAINNKTIDYYCVNVREDSDGSVTKQLVMMEKGENAIVDEEGEERGKTKSEKDEKRKADARAYEEDTHRREALLQEAVGLANERRMAFVNKIPENEAMDQMGTVLCYFIESAAEELWFQCNDDPFGAAGIRKTVCESMEEENSDMTMIEKPAKFFLMMVFMWMDADARDWREYVYSKMRPKRNESAWRVYRMFNELGYEIADDEKSMLEGKADYYRKEVEDEDSEA